MFVTHPEERIGKGQENICSTREGNVTNFLESKADLGEST